MLHGTAELVPDRTAPTRWTRRKKALGAIYGMVQQQAAMLSFVEAFWVMGVIFLGMLPLLFLLRNARDLHPHTPKSAVQRSADSRVRRWRLDWKLQSSEHGAGETCVGDLSCTDRRSDRLLHPRLLPLESTHAMPPRPRHASPYRGRLAPSPTGLLHLGHACTFWTAYQRSLEHGGTLVFRNEDLDPQRSKPEFAEAMIEDLRWLGIRWQEGPDVGGPFAPYEQSRRREFYLAAWRKLRDGGFIYPCNCSRKDLATCGSRAQRRR